MRPFRSAMATAIILAFTLACDMTASRGDEPAPPPANAKPAPPAEAAPQAKPAEPPPAPQPPPAPPPSITVIEADEAHSILGREVVSATNEAMGRIVDVIVDRGGEPRGAVIDFGGFLGVGSRKIVVDWGALRFWTVTDKSATIGLDLTHDQVKAAPEYKEDQPVIILGAAGSLHPLRFRPAPKPKEN
jgi:hypothetical protein